MNVTLNLSLAVEKALMARARERGVSLDAYLQDVVAREAGAAIQSVSQTRRHIGDLIRERMSKVPPGIMAAMPKDGASQHDHYIYGFPKREE